MAIKESDVRTKLAPCIGAVIDCKKPHHHLAEDVAMARGFEAEAADESKRCCGGGFVVVPSHQPLQIGADEMLLEAHIEPNGARVWSTCKVADFLKVFEHAASLSYAALVAEDAILRDPQTGAPRTDADAVGRTKGWKSVLDDWLAKGLLTP